jgi:hypothetical protein
VANVDQTVFDIGANDLVIPFVERTEDIDLSLLELLRVEPIANLAIAPASADVDLGRVDHIGDKGQTAGGGHQPIQVGKRRRPHLQNRPERVDFAQAGNRPVDEHGPRDERELWVRDSGHGVSIPDVDWDRRPGACRLIFRGGNPGSSGEKPYKK